MTQINTAINRYLADAQWRTAELTGEMDDIKDDGNIGFQRRDNIRLQLSTFMDLVFVADYSFYEGYNLLYASDTPWTDAEIQAEIDYLRDIGEMNEVPFLSFVDYQQNVVMRIIDEGDTPSIPGGGINFPNGASGDFLYYANGGNSPIATPFPTIVGHTSETIDSYFLGRS